MTVDKNAREAIRLHEKLKGKIMVTGRMSKLRPSEIKLIYTPGVAAVCEEIYHHPEKKYTLTSKGNNVAIVTDGTRILGLGNIGPYAAMPVMEGKAVLYHEFGGVSAFPICVDTTKKEEIISTVRAIAPVFGAINLEDIESPKVLEISDELTKSLNIPVSMMTGMDLGSGALCTYELPETRKSISHRHALSLQGRVLRVSVYATS